MIKVIPLKSVPIQTRQHRRKGLAYKNSMTEFEIIEVVLKVSLLLSPSLLLLPFNTKAKRYLIQYEKKIVHSCIPGS